MDTGNTQKGVQSIFESVVKSQFDLPLTKNIHWKNNKLYHELSFVKNYPVTFVQAPTGYGKSKNMALYLKNNYLTDDVYWYQLHEKDNRVINLWQSLIYLFINDNQEKKENLYDKDENDLDLYDNINDLLNFISDKLKREGILVLDNAHLLSNRELLSSLAYFINLLPAKLHLVLIGRGEIFFSQKSNWKINKKVFVIGKDEFTLDKIQLEDFLLIQHRFQLSSKKLEKILFYTEGWIAAVDYIAQIVKQEKDLDIEQIFKKEDQFLDNFYDYLDFEILNNPKVLRPPLKKYLLKSSLLEELDLDICSKFMDLENCQKMIEYFIEIGIPVKKVSEENYRYNKLFQYYLNNRAYSKYNFKKLHEKALEIYSNNGKPEGKVYHLLELDDKEQLVSFIKTKAVSLMEADSFDLLESMLLKLSREYYDNNPVLYLYRGDVYFAHDQLELALESYQKAEKKFRAIKDENYFIKVLFRILKVYFSIHSTHGFEYLNCLEKHVKKLTEEQYQSYLGYKVIAMFIKGEVNKAFCFLEQLDEVGGDLKKFEAIATFLKGNLGESLELLLSVKEGEQNYFIEYLYILLFLFKGHKYQAMELIWDRIKFDQVSEIEVFFENLRLTFFQLLGGYRAADNRERYHQLLKKGQNSILYTSWCNRQTFISLLNWEANFGDPDQGIQKAKEKLNRVEGLDPFYKAQLHQLMGINYYSKLNFVEAEKFFNSSLKIVNSGGNQLNIAVSLYWLVLTKFKRERNIDRELLQKLLIICKDKTYDFLFVKSNVLANLDPNVFVPILLEARKSEIEKDYINKLLSKINLSAIDQHPGYSLTFNTLGGFELYRGCTEVKEKKWKRSKSKKLLYIFLINYDNKLSRERLYNYLWPDKIDKAAKQNFYVVLGSLNKILEPDKGPQQETCFIESKNSYYGLTRRFTYFYDVAQFEEFIFRGKNTGNKNIRINYYLEAIEIYKGNFMPEVSGLDWIDKERERLRKLFVEVALEVIEYYYQKGEYQFCIKIADKIQTVDPYFDESYLYKMKSYYNLGKNGLVIKTYQECNKIFRDELKIAPSSAIENFYQQISYI